MRHWLEVGMPQGGIALLAVVSLMKPLALWQQSKAATGAKMLAVVVEGQPQLLPKRRQFAFVTKAIYPLSVAPSLVVSVLLAVILGRNNAPTRLQPHLFAQRLGK